MKTIAAVVLALLCAPAFAETSVWLTTGMSSHHVDRSTPYRENNTGMGLELHVGPDTSYGVGRYMNSLNRQANYVTCAYQPLHFGQYSKIGILSVAASGYRQNEKNFIVAPLPIYSFEKGDIGFNLMVVPGVVTAIQLKFKL